MVGSLACCWPIVLPQSPLYHRAVYVTIGASAVESAAGGQLLPCVLLQKRVGASLPFPLPSAEVRPIEKTV